jgi:cyclophilin family peptidyl-prolyl cis-trans isomerase
MYKRFMLLSVAAAVLAGCHSKPTPSDMEVVEAADVESQVQAAEVNAASDVVEEAAPSAAAVQPQEPERNTVMILMKTSKGNIKIELYPEQAPKTVENFLSYVEAGHYSGTIFHRVMNGFMIQGGGMDVNMQQKPAPRTVENEANNGLKNTVGSVAMARMPDPHSASAQFFINVNDNAFLDFPGQDGWGYCVFGQVVDGMDVVNAIKTVPTEYRLPHQHVPTDPVIIEQVSVIEE